VKRDHLWIVAVAIALIFIALDSTARLRTIWTVTNLRVATSPAVREDSNTITGYAANQHQLILPAFATDGYHWMMQADEMVAGREGWRVRHVDYDHPPDGRDVEWSGFLHWELAAVAWVGTHLTAIELAPDSWIARARDLMFGPYRAGGLPMNLAMERVAPWTNTLTLVLFVLLTVPLVAWRFGALSASLLALGFVVIQPFYQFFSVGYFDHHGLAATWDLLMVVCLVAGGAGWLRPHGADVSRLTADERAVSEWLPTRMQARRWFVASAIAGGAGLWESAASTVPAMAGVAIGALVSTAWLGRQLPRASPWRVEPTLWRTWGTAGAASSLCFYALEFLPSHFGWNLQINHPLYAVAWFGAGDLLCRVCEWILRGKLAQTRADTRAGVLIGLDVLLVAALPVTIALTSKDTFVIADSFLWTLCVDYILEIQSLFRQFARMSAVEILGRVSVVPLLLLPVVALLWRIDRPSTSRAVWRAMLVALSVPAIVFAHATFYAVIFHALQESAWLAAGVGQGESLAHLLALVPDVLTVVVLFGVPIYLKPAPLSLPWKGLLSVALFPALVLLVLALRQSRWLGIACALWVGVLLTVVLVCGRSKVLDRRFLPSAGVFLAVVLLPFPAYTITQWIRFGLTMPVTQVDLTEVITRDASYRIRQRLGDEPGIVVSGPSTSTWMTYFGGLKGLGTLYSENLDGLKAVASIYSATSADEALGLCRRYGVTHLAIFSWDAFAEEYTKLWRGVPAQDPAPSDAFILRILKTGNLPSWLRPLPYPIARQKDLANQWVRLFEVVPDQTIQEATVRVAQYLWAEDKPDAALRQLRPLVAREPDYLPALICLARIQQSRGELDAFGATLQRIRANVASADTLRLDDRVDLAVVMALANDPVHAREEVLGAWEHADETSLRHLLPDTLINLVGITRSLNLTEQFAGPYHVAFDLLPPETQAAFGDDRRADAEMRRSGASR
jgi:hypothetical protein